MEVPSLAKDEGMDTREGFDALSVEIMSFQCLLLICKWLLLVG